MSVKALWNEADAYTIEDGGVWLSTEGILTPPGNVHSLRLLNGREWDVRNGLRPMTQSESNEPVFTLAESPTFTGLINISCSITHEELKTLTSGGTVRVAAANGVEIQLTLDDGHVDAVRDSIAKARSDPASRE
jgi:hypothetical protein